MPFQAGWDVAWSTGTSSTGGHSVVGRGPSPPCTGATTHPASEKGAHLQPTPVAWASRVPPVFPGRPPTTGAAAFTGAAVSRHGHGQPHSMGRQGSTAARKGPNTN